MEKEFEEWYKDNERRFYCGQFDEKQIAYSAWSEAYKKALSMSGVMQGSIFRICKHCNTEYPIKFAESVAEFVSAMQECPHCKCTDHVWVRFLKNPA